MDWQNIKLTFWQSGDAEKGTVSAVTYAGFINTWFIKVRQWLQWPLQRFYLENAPLFFVDLVAWERNITRFNSEPESLYRLRVKYAYANAKDAGSTAGFKRIWQRLELGDVSITERSSEEDWDIIILGMAAADIAGNETLLNLLITKYGRTCRRYLLSSQSVADVSAAVAKLATASTFAVCESDIVLPPRGSAVPDNALTYSGDPLTFNDDYLTFEE